MIVEVTITIVAITEKIKTNQINIWYNTIKKQIITKKHNKPHNKKCKEKTNN